MAVGESRSGRWRVAAACALLATMAVDAASPVVMVRLGPPYDAERALAENVYPFAGGFMLWLLLAVGGALLFAWREAPYERRPTDPLGLLALGWGGMLAWRLGVYAFDAQTNSPWLMAWALAGVTAAAGYLLLQLAGPARPPFRAAPKAWLPPALALGIALGLQVLLPHGPRPAPLAIEVLHDPEAPDPERRPVLVWMHGASGRPDMELPFFARLAEDLDIVVVQIAGPNISEAVSHGYDWDERAWVDGARIRDGLEAAATQTAFDRERVLLSGFSQGALVAVGVSGFHPESYLGAIGFSPGFIRGWVPRDFPELTDRKFSISYNEHEFAKVGRVSRALRERLVQAGANVELRMNAGVTEHDLPEDFEPLLRRWLLEHLER